ncbi:MAG: hypothetical protein KBC43_04260 [Bacteroidales bacterium]|nr:hypothetical protein [Bacteroidales bacterium]
MNRHYCFATINRYNPYGYLSSIARGDTEKDIWRLEEMNPRGLLERFALGYTGRNRIANFILLFLSV